MELSGQIHAALPPGKELLVPFGYEDGWAPETVWKRWRSLKFPSCRYRD